MRGQRRARLDSRGPPPPSSPPQSLPGPPIPDDTDPGAPGLPESREKEREREKHQLRRESGRGLSGGGCRNGCRNDGGGVPLRFRPAAAKDLLHRASGQGNLLEPCCHHRCWLRGARGVLELAEARPCRTRGPFRRGRCVRRARSRVRGIRGCRRAPASAQHARKRDVAWGGRHE